MSLRGLTSVAIYVPKVDETALYCRNFRRASRTDLMVAFRDVRSGEQLKLVHAHPQGVVELRCSTNYDCLQSARSNFLQHTCWQVDDVLAHMPEAHSK